MRAASRKRFRTLILCLFMVCVVNSRSDAGLVCDTIGKGLDKLGAGVYKVANKACKLKPDGKLVKGVKKKIKKKKKAGGCLKNAFKKGKSCGCNR